MDESNNLIQPCDQPRAGADCPETALHRAAQTMLTHSMTLEVEGEAADMLRAMGVAEPTGADGLMLAQYLKALRGDTASAKFVRDAASALEQGPPDSYEPDLAALTDSQLRALLAEAES